MRGAGLFGGTFFALPAVPAAPAVYFAYGSNLDPERLRARVPGARLVGAARLRGYALVFASRPAASGFGFDGRPGVANIVPRPGAVVFGALYGLTPAALRDLDLFEGTPHVYRRVCLRPQRHAARTCEAAAVYQMPATPLRAPTAMYADYLRRGYAFWGLPVVPLETALAAAGYVDTPPHRG